MVTSIKDVASAAASLDPLHAGLPLAGFCLLMQVWPVNSYARLVGDTDVKLSRNQRFGPIRSHNGRRGRDCHDCGTISAGGSIVPVATKNGVEARI